MTDLLGGTPEKILKLFGIAFTDANDGWMRVQCPAHGDHAELAKAHGGVNRESGAFHCVNCRQDFDMFGFVQAVTGMPRHAVADRIGKTFGKSDPLMSPAFVQACKRILMADEDAKRKLASKGINFDSIDKFDLGFNPADSRITIPVYDEHKQLVNVRQYTFEKAKSNKKIINAKGCGRLRLYGVEVLDTPGSDTVYIAEGELKRILLCQHGFNAIAPTGGAGNWNDDWNILFKNKDVVVVYDVDQEGRDGAARLCRALCHLAKSVRDVFLTEVADPTKYKGGDITNWIVDEGKTADDFRQLCLATAPYVAPHAPANGSENDDDCEPVETTLAESVKAEFAGKKISTTFMVSAKAQHPFIVPNRCTVMCNADKEYCNLCHVSDNRYYQFTVKGSDKAIYDMVGATEKQRQDILKRESGIYSGCKASKIRVDESLNLEEVRAIPVISIGAETEENVVRQVFTVGLGVKSNAPYRIEARVLSGKDTRAALLAYSAEPTQDDLKTFELQHDLSLFQPAEWTAEALTAKLDDIYEDLESNVTHIYRRRDLHLFFDLIWHSCLFVRFQGKQQKGYVDALCIGDSGQGKTEIGKYLIQHYRCGERIDAKGATVAGLLGGLQEMAGTWYVTWGAVPLNDKRLVLLEEVKGLGAEELCKLTDMRSSGIAELKKIIGEKTHARTRLGWISNPRGQSKLGHYNYGVEAVRELIGSLEDIRRFDMVIGVASGDVPSHVLNLHSRQRPQCPHLYNSEICSHLIHWIWSRTDEQIIVTEEAEEAILECTKRLSADFSDAVPIVSPADQRHKVLRLSAALAGRTYSTEDDRNLTVRSCHVAVIEDFLYRIYSASSLGYAEFSAAQFQEQQLSKPEDVIARIAAMPNARDAANALLDAAAFTWQDVANYTDWDQDKSKEFIAYLAKAGAVKRNSTHGTYRKSAAFIVLLRHLVKSGKLNNESRVEQINKGEL